jgi:catechol 2,3-dioxygenase-like lactoylglutathione lyase family enzyme
VDSLSTGGVLESCLYAVNLEETARFYERVLGLVAFSRVGDRHVFFRCGRGMFLLFNPRLTERPEGDVPAHGARGPGHVAFAVRGDQLDLWRNRLAAGGAAIEQEVTWPNGSLSLYLRDPAGNSVELGTPRIWGIEEVRGADAG